MGCLATLGLMTTGMAFAQDNLNREAIAERLEPVGELCLEGEDCGTAMTAATTGGGSAASGTADGESIYNNVCMACHETGAAGAPVRGDEAGWGERTGKGFETLVSHAIDGFNAMPARGGNPNLSDEEVQAAVAYLVEPVMEVPEAAAEAAPTEEAVAEEAVAEEGATEQASAEAATEGEATSAGNGLDGEALYGSSGCAACHDSGAAGAPVLGDAEAWAPRIEQGKETLYASAINGKGAMPPKGGNMSLADEKVKAIVDYMVSQAE
nr:c-type cytochrome [Halomonas cerina]